MKFVNFAITFLPLDLKKLIQEFLQLLIIFMLILKCILFLKFVLLLYYPKILFNYQ